MVDNENHRTCLVVSLSLSLVCVSHAQRQGLVGTTAAECAKLGFVSVLFFKIVLRGPHGKAKVKKITFKKLPKKS